MLDAGDQLAERRLARPGRARQRDARSRRQRQREAVDQRRIERAIAERHVVHLQPPARQPRLDRRLGRGEARIGRLFHDVVEPARVGADVLQLLGEIDELEHRRRETDRQRLEGDQLAERHTPTHHRPAAADQHHRGDQRTDQPGQHREPRRDARDLLPAVLDID